MRAIRASLVLIIVMATAVLLSPGVRSEHQEDHRYFIVGTITDEFGEPLCGATVRAADIDKPSPDNNRTAVTDGSGGYRIQLHMHDDFDLEANVARQVHNVGDRILVTVEGSPPSAVITAQKNAGDPEGWGLKTVNLVAEGLQGRCISFVQLALIGLGVVAAVVAVFGAVLLLRRTDRLGRGSRAGLKELPGVGRARARELEGFGIRSVEDLAAASPEKLSASTTLTPKQARLLVKRANDALGGKP